VKNRTVSAGERLNSYFANVKATNLADALKRSAANWQVYAAVTGSAMAMATNASAGAIVYDNAKRERFREQPGCHFGQKRYQRRRRRSEPDLRARSQTGFRRTTSGTCVHFKPGRVWIYYRRGFVQKLASNAPISSLGAFKQSTQFAIAKQPGLGTWSIAHTGFAGFRFTTSGSHQTDYGWVRLEYTEGTNGLAKSITAVDWAYDTSGAPITAGDVGAPEPSTTALAILAAGAAGVAALRRRRNASA
jgi:hypothetical protein